MDQTMKWSREQILKDINAAAWAIMPEALQAIITKVSSQASFSIDAKTIEALARPSVKTPGGVAILNLSGTLTQKENFFCFMCGGTSVEAFGRRFDEAVANPNIKAIVINVDSPGGEVSGIPELADKILQARGEKHIVAIANSIMASAAFWVAAAADEVVITPSGQMGSVGTVFIHHEISEQLKENGIKVTIFSAGDNKVNGNTLEPLTEEATAEIQETVDGFNDMFVAGLAKARGVSKTFVNSNFGQGKMFMAKDAVKLGLADRVATLDQVLSKLGVSMSAATRLTAEGEPAQIAASDKHLLDNRLKLLENS